MFSYAEGYHWDGINQLAGGQATAGTVQDKIDGKDPEVYGGMQGAYPGWYGGERVDLFGGIEVASQQFGLRHTKLAIEAGFPLYQNLNARKSGKLADERRPWHYVLGVWFCHK